MYSFFPHRNTSNIAGLLTKCYFITILSILNQRKLQNSNETITSVKFNSLKTIEVCQIQAI